MMLGAAPEVSVAWAEEEALGLRVSLAETEAEDCADAVAVAQAVLVRRCTVLVGGAEAVVVAVPDGLEEALPPLLPVGEAEGVVRGEVPKVAVAAALPRALRVPREEPVTAEDTEALIEALAVAVGTGEEEGDLRALGEREKGGV